MKIRIGTQYRSQEIAKDAVEVDTRIVSGIFSSEMPCLRMAKMPDGKEFKYYEVLGHEDGECDMSRLLTGAPFLYDHDPKDQRGVVETALKDGGANRFTARMSRNPKGEELLTDINDGIRRKISVGYNIDKLVDTRQKLNGIPILRATAWKPMELSSVSIAFDDSVGTGRANEEAVADVEVHASAEQGQGETPPQKNKVEPNLGVRTMTPEEIKAAQDAAIAAAREADKKRRMEIIEIAKQFGMEQRGMEAVAQDTSVEDFRSAVLAECAKARKTLVTDPNVGMSKQEVRRFSVLNVLRAMDTGDWSRAGFELESSRAHAKLIGKEARGCFIPNDVLNAFFRADDMNVTTATAGGNLVQTSVLFGSFIEYLRNNTVCIKAGAVALTGLVGNIAIPRQTGASTATWVGESTAPSNTAPSIDQVPMSPKTLSAFTDFSRKLFLQSGMDVEMLIRNDLMNVLAIELDRVGLLGSGVAPQPKGISATASIGGDTWDSANSPTFAEFVAMETAVLNANAMIGSATYVLNPTMSGYTKSAPKIGSTFPIMIQEKGEINGYPVSVSKQLSTAGNAIFGVFSQLVFGFWSGLDIMVDPYSLSTSGSRRVVAHQDCDVAVRHPGAFVLNTNAST